MPELILHNYPSSPFSEKMRLVLGFKQLPWRFVTSPRIAPKPDLVALTGGYRRTPVLQVGADIYCDTALMCDVLEHLQSAPTLYPEPEKGLGRVMSQWADNTLFWSAMAWNLQPAGRAQLFAGASPEAMKAFVQDRGAMSEGNMVRQRPEDAAAAYKSYLRRLSDMLDDRPFLLGELPCIADFSAYHPLWFTRTRVPTVAHILDLTPAVVDWMDRMALIGHGDSTEMDVADAIALAAAATPLPVEGDVFQDDHGIALGSRVSVHAETFGTEKTEGVLVSATRMHLTLRREDARSGVVHVHFPRIGYVLERAE